MSGNGRKQEGLAQAERLKKAMSELAHWRDRGPTLRTRINAFFDLESAFFDALQSSDNSSPPTLVPSAIRNMLKQTAKHPAVILPFFGSNSCGKSTLLNSLLGANVLPVGNGYTTGRICAISFAELSEASIETTTLDKFQTGDPAPSEFQTLNDASIDELGDKLKQHLQRPNALSADWIELVVHLRYPFEFLRHGVTLVDLPGTSNSDNTAAQEQLKQFFTSVRPVGVCFLYKNPSFADNETAALKVLTTALEQTNDANMDTEIFFVSTHLDVATIMLDNGDGGEFCPKWVERARSNRWELLQSARESQTFKEAVAPLRGAFSPQPAPSQPTLSSRSLSQNQPSPAPGTPREPKLPTQANPQPRTFESGPNFCVVNAGEYLDRSNPELGFGPKQLEAVEFVFGEFRVRLLAFAAVVQRLRYKAVYQRLLDGSAQSFRLYNAYRSQDQPRRLQEAEEAMDAANGLKQALIEASQNAIDSIQDALREAVRIHRPSIWMSVNIVTSFFDSMRLEDYRNDCLKRITSEVSDYVKKEVVPEVLAELDTKVGDAIAEVIRERLAPMNKNLILDAALRDFVVVGSIQSPSMGIVSPILHRLARSVQPPNLDSFVATTSLLLVSAGFARIRDTLWKKVSSTTINEDWRRKTLIAVTEGIIADVAPQPLKDIATKNIDKFTSDVLERINAECKDSTTAFTRFTENQQLFRKMRLEFATHECECWIDLRKLDGELGSLEFEQQQHDLSASTLNAVTADRKIPNSRYSRAIWTTERGERKCVIVKRLPDPNDLAVRLSFLEEAHYSLHIRRVSEASFLPPMLLPALAVHHDPRQQPPSSSTSQMTPSTSPSSNTQMKNYVLIFDNVMGDLETLFQKLLEAERLPDHHTPSTIDCVYLCLQAALGVESLHQYGMTHRKVTPRSLWYCIVDGHCMAYLTDLSATTMSTANYARRVSIQGAPMSFQNWEPPEIANAAKSLRQTMSSSGPKAMRSTSGSDSPSSSTGSLRLSRNARGSAYSNECDIWMLGKTMQWIVNRGVEENDLKSAERKWKNELQTFLESSPLTYFDAVDTSYTLAHDWFVLVDEMLRSDPSARPNATQVVDRLKELIDKHLRLVELSPSFAQRMSKILESRAKGNVRKATTGDGSQFAFDADIFPHVSSSPHLTREQQHPASPVPIPYDQPKPDLDMHSDTYSSTVYSSVHVSSSPDLTREQQHPAPPVSIPHDQLKPDLNMRPDNYSTTVYSSMRVSFSPDLTRQPQHLAPPASIPHDQPKPELRMRRGNHESPVYSEDV